MNRPTYFDYMATTPVDPAVMEVMQHYLTLQGQFGNPASNTHYFGEQAALAVKSARQQVAELIGAKPREIIWTSGATEANNLAIIGAARFHVRSGCHLITVKTEHKSVLDSAAYLAQSGFEVTYLDVDRHGQIDQEQLLSAIRPDTILISVMHVNNETGVIQDIESIGTLAHQHGVLFHVDAAQSVGKCAIDLSSLPVDMMSFSAHKLYGPKGIGALYVRQQPRVRIEPMIYGGGHEWGLRSGTLPTQQIAGMGEAFALAKQRYSLDCQYIRQLEALFVEGISSCSGLRILAEGAQKYPGCVNLFCADCDAETLLAALPQFALSTGSACNAVKSEPSHVLLAMGLSHDEAERCVRISFGRYTTVEQVMALISALQQVILSQHQIDGATPHGEIDE